MRTVSGLLVALLVVLAGCGAGFQGSPAAPASPDGNATAASPTPTPTSTPASTPTPDPASNATTVPPDPPADRLGWEGGYWHNESLSITAEDGLNGSERRAVVTRAMARVERIRELEFERRVPVSVISREEYRTQYAGGRADYGPDFRLFDNAKFEALFLIGEDEDSLAVQNRNRGSTVLGFYSPRNDTIVLVSESENPVVRDELTLGHELVHALQDQHYNLSSYAAHTRDGHNAQNGVIEGDANYVQRRYEENCGEGWECISVEGGNDSAPSDFHVGVYALNYFPYSDGPGFVDHFYDRGGWAAVNDLYARMPASAEQVIYPDRYPDEPVVNVTIEDAPRNGWRRVSPAPPRPGQARPNYATLGQSAMTAMFAYTLYDEYNRSRVIEPTAFLNLDDGQVNRTDPFNYASPYVDGWAGDRMYVYANPSTGNETAYVWKSVWDSPAEAREFARGYRALLAHWGGERVAENVWRVENSPFADAFHVRVEGDTVVIVNAPTREALGDIHPGAR